MCSSEDRVPSLFELHILKDLPETLHVLTIDIIIFFVVNIKWIKIFYNISTKQSHR